MSDTEPDIARDAGPLNLREAHAALDLHIARALKRGDDGCAVDLQAVADVLDQYADEIEQLKRAGSSLVRQVLASRESLQ